jgi:hypothetical protein
VARQKGVDVGCLSCLHGGRGTGKFRKDGSVVLLIPDLVAHEDNPALELSCRVTERKLGALLVAQFEDTANVDLRLVPLGLCLELGKLNNNAFIPSTSGPEGDSSLGRGGAGYFSLVDGSGYESPWSVDHVHVLDPVDSVGNVPFGDWHAVIVVGETGEGTGGGTSFDKFFGTSGEIHTLVVLRTSGEIRIPVIFARMARSGTRNAGNAWH